MPFFWRGGAPYEKEILPELTCISDLHSCAIPLRGEVVMEWHISGDIQNCMRTLANYVILLPSPPKTKRNSMSGKVQH